MSRHPIVDVQTHMYSLTGVPIYVHQGDWIAGKACGCATIAHPELGEIDVWTTHFTAVGGQIGPETQRAFRTVEAFELARLCRASAQRGRHVLCMGDLNSLPESLCMSVLFSLAGLQDSFASITQQDAESPDTGITCDSPKNTWTANKILDERALRHNGKRLDYILFRGPENSPMRLQCTQHKVTLTEPILAYGVSYSDHFGVEATFEVSNDTQNAPIFQETPSQVLGKTLPLLQEALRLARKRQIFSLRFFGGFLASAAIMIVGNACSAVWLSYGRSVPVSLISGLLLILTSWAGTTALYDGIVWGEWQKRALRTTMDRMEILQSADSYQI
ncbi:sphingomyelin phosphodiesterase [Malassezia psittaci]|uniref:Sphingomyelin phosphodiesterase n=1 Tax=Malassezia psittaci TaxID=1821823 RepID=A0AAF0F9V1_9BASI|nr:sphingomyelin phosphodiesterase [Malassezia psittaci]